MPSGTVIMIAGIMITMSGQLVGAAGSNTHDVGRLA